MAIPKEELDDLVDGELGESERRAMFARLENEPTEWRSCALAFLERQSLRETMGAIADEASIPSPGEEATADSRTPGWRLTAAAAVVMLAFVAGWMSSPERSAGQGAPDEETATGPGDTEETMGGPRVVAVAQLGPDGEAVPILSGPGIDEEWLMRQPPALPEHARRDLERQGYRVEQARRLVVVQTADGHRLTIPIDALRLEFVGREIY